MKKQTSREQTKHPLFRLFEIHLLEAAKILKQRYNQKNKPHAQQ